MSVLIGGENAWKQYVSGDIVISYQWVNNEPAMILYPKVKRTNHAGAFAICLSAAHQYVKNDGHPDLGYMIPKCAQAAEVMGFENSRFIIRRIADAILDGMEDLLKMPPERPAKEVQTGPVIGEMAIRDGGRTIKEMELTAPTIQELSTFNRTVH